MKEGLPAKVGIFLEAEVMAMMVSLGDDVAAVLEKVWVEWQEVTEWSICLLQIHFLVLLALKAVRHVRDYVEVSKIVSEFS